MSDDFSVGNVGTVPCHKEIHLVDASKGKVRGVTDGVARQTEFIHISGCESLD
jgi:hypothetical protein